VITLTRREESFVEGKEKKGVPKRGGRNKKGLASRPVSRVSQKKKRKRKKRGKDLCLRAVRRLMAKEGDSPARPSETRLHLSGESGG